MTELSAEREVRHYLTENGIPFVDNTRSFVELDFSLLKDGAPLFHLEVKEKRQPYRSDRWPYFAPEAELCILDDLTVRKCLGFAPASGILVRDNVRGGWVFFPVIDLALMPKLRVNRPIRHHTADMKGKWLIHFANGKRGETLDQAFAAVRTYYGDLPVLLHEIHACYGQYVGETIEQGGSERQPDHWVHDVAATR